MFIPSISSVVTTVVVIAGTAIVLASGEEPLTDKEKEALATIKTRVLDKLPHDYMKEDLYLTRFLRARYFDVDQAEKLLLDNVKWREENKMDTIHLENFDDIESMGYKTFFESVDLQGKPIITASIQDWDLRMAVATGIQQRLERYSDRNFEVGARKVREIRAAGNPNVTQFDFIGMQHDKVNMDTYNKIQHGCVECIPMYVYIIKSFEDHYPEHTDLMLLFNTPQIFGELLNIIRPFMSPITNKALKILDHDKAKWEAELAKYVAKSELPPEFGGTKIYKG